MLAFRRSLEPQNKYTCNGLEKKKKLNTLVMGRTIYFKST